MSDLPLDRRAVRHQRVAVGERPAGILHIGDLQPLGAERKRELDEFRHLLDIVAVDRRVDGERQAGRPRAPRRLQLLLVAAAMVADAFGGRRPRALEAQLQMVEPGFGERLDAAFGNADAGGDQIGVDAARRKPGHQLLEVAAQGRLAAGKMHLQHAEVGRLLEQVEPASAVSSSRLAFSSSVGLEQ